MLEARVLGAHAFPLLLLRREPFQLEHRILDAGALGFARGEILLRLLRHSLEALPGAEGFRRLAHELGRAGMRVEDLALRRGAKQRLVLMLAVQVDEALSRLAELRERRGMAVDEAARSPRGIDGSSENDLARIAGQFPLLEPGGNRPFK